MAVAFCLTPEQHRTFERDGMLRIPAHFSRDRMEAAAERIWMDLHWRFGIDRERRETWRTERPAQFQALTQSGAFDDLGAGLTSIGEAFFGHDGCEPQRHFGQPLVTFPGGRWELPHTMWHIDIPPTDIDHPFPLVRAFVLLEAVRPEGGGTCYVEGSHRVVQCLASGSRQSLRSQEVRSLLAQTEPWFAGLFAPSIDNREEQFMHSAMTNAGVEVAVRETTGEPGDVYVMHPAMLHTAAPNGLDRPRMMLGQNLERRRRNSVP